MCRKGIAPTLIYPVPSGDSHPILGNIIHSIRDYYPLWQVRMCETQDFVHVFLMS